MVKNPVLMVEDNPDDEFLALRELKKCGIEGVVVTRDGAEAVDYLFGTGKHAGRDKTFMPRMILLDLKLPRMNGLEVLRAIRDDENMRDIPVIVTSSSQEPSDIESCRKLGVEFFLNKTLDCKKLVEVMKYLEL